MKKLLLIGTLFISSNVFASDVTLTDSQKANPNDPCTIVLCMAAKLTGDSGGDDCKAAQEVFFATNAFKHGSFNPTKTLKKRTSLLSGCPDGSDQAKKILSKFGKAKG